MCKPLRILIVEDEALLAFQLEMDLVDAGHDVVGSAPSSGRAIRLAEATDPDLALVDIHLADGPTGVTVAEALRRRGQTVVVFMTANVRRIPADFAGAVGVIGKPYTANGLSCAIDFMARAMDGGVLPPPPAGLQLAPERLPANDGFYRFRVGS